MGDAKPSAAQQLTRAIAEFSPEVRALAKQALAKLRARLPGATELVYNNYALTVGFSPTDRPSDAVVAINIYKRCVNLGFIEGALLDDPARLLLGSGSQFRHIRLNAAADLDAPGVRALVDQAVANAAAPFDAKRRRRIDVRTVSAKQGPRRPGSRRASTGTASPRRTPRASRPRGRPAR
jgi:hypothetical protein